MYAEGEVDQEARTTGPADDVEENKAAFERFVESVRFDDGKGDNDG